MVSRVEESYSKDNAYQQTTWSYFGSSIISRVLIKVIFSIKGDTLSNDNDTECITRSILNGKQYHFQNINKLYNTEFIHEIIYISHI